MHILLFIVSTIDLKTKFRIHWQSRDLTSTEECAVQIPYEGIPFIYIGEKAYMCHLGRSKSGKGKEPESFSFEVSLFFFVFFVHVCVCVCVIILRILNMFLLNVYLH